MIRNLSSGSPFYALALVGAVLGGCGPATEESGSTGTPDPTDSVQPTATPVPATDPPVVTPTPPDPTDPPPPPTDAPTPTDVPPPTPKPTEPPPPPTDPPPPPATFYVARTFPDSTSYAVPLGGGFKVEYNEVLPTNVNPASDITVTLTPAGGSPFNAQYVSPATVGFGANYSANLQPATDYTFTVTLGPNVPYKDGKSTYSGTFSTRVPCGVAFQVGGDVLEITKFGSATRAGLQSLNQGLDSVDQNLLAMFDGVSPTDSLPLEGSSSFATVLGPYLTATATSGSLDTSVGLPGSFGTCTVGSGGNLYCSTPLLLVPLNVGNPQKYTLAYLYVHNAVATGQVITGTSWDINGLKMNGIVTKTDVEAFIASAGPVVGGAVESVAGSSYDTTYNGEQALNVEISTEPLAFSVNGCTP